MADLPTSPLQLHPVNSGHCSTVHLLLFGTTCLFSQVHTKLLALTLTPSVSPPTRFGLQAATFLNYFFDVLQRTVL